MSKRVFRSGNYQTAISYVFLALPYLGALAFLSVGAWFALPIAIVVSYAFYATVFHRYIRCIVLKDGRIKALPSLTPIDQIQYKVDEPLSEIVSITYAFAQDDSEGNQIYHAWDIPCLRLILQGGKEATIMLCGYSKEQIDALEKAIKEEKQSIVFTNDSKTLFIK